jgi:hypothetical protein
MRRKVAGLKKFSYDSPRQKTSEGSFNFALGHWHSFSLVWGK